MFITWRQFRGDNHKQPSQTKPPSIDCIRISSQLARYESGLHMSVSMICTHIHAMATRTSA